MFKLTHPPIRALGFAFVLLLSSAPAAAGTLTIPNTFSANTTAVAAEVNANFDAAKTAVDDNDSRIVALETRKRQVVGWTSTPFGGRTGMLTLIQACGSDFPGSIVATSTDVTNTTTLVALPTGLAWLRPELVVAMPVGGLGFVYDKSGVSVSAANQSFTLGAVAGFGLAMTPAGQFSTLILSTALPVACAK